MIAPVALTEPAHSQILMGTPRVLSRRRASWLQGNL
jgi:hypothetical protein